MQKYKRILIISTTTIAASLICAAAYRVFADSLQSNVAQHVKSQQQQLAAIAADEIERYFYDITKRMETIALMSEVRDARRSEGCNQTLQKLVETNSAELNNLGRVSKDGSFICAVNRTIIGEPVAKYGDYFQKIASDPQHKPAISRLIFPTGSASPVIAVHVPVYDSGGNFNGTIGGAVYFDELQQRLLAGIQSRKQSVAIYDNNLDILYNPDPLIQAKNLAASEVKWLYSPTTTVDQFIEKVKMGVIEGDLNYSLRGMPQQAVYRRAEVADRHWTVVIAAPAKDIQTIIGQETAKKLFVAISFGLIIAVTALAYVITFRALSNARQKK